MTIDELRKGEHEAIEYKLDIPAEKEKYLKTAVFCEMTDMHPVCRR